MSRLLPDISITGVFHRILNISTALAGGVHNILSISWYTYMSETTEVSPLFQDPVWIIFSTLLLKPAECLALLVTL